MVTDDLFQQALGLIGTGDHVALEKLLAAHPELARERLTSPGAWLRKKIGKAADGFFKDPYLLWFVAEDLPVLGHLPSNIVEVARVILTAARGFPNFQDQLDSTLRMVCWSHAAHQSGHQLPLIDLLLDAGAASTGAPDNALVNGHLAAAEHLVGRGAPLTLASAACLGKWDAAERLALSAPANDKQFALVLAALNGNEEAARFLLRAGADANRPSPDLYAHASPLHHAVCSGSLPTVQALVEAAANPSARDTAWEGTPLGWSEHYLSGKKDADSQKRYGEIAAYLRSLSR